MDRLTKVSGFFYQRLRTTALLIVFVCATLFLLIAAQYTAAALLPVIVLLLRAIERRDQRAQALAERITDERQIEKVEVPAGAWGALARAVNGLLQERRVEQRLRDALPEPLPLEAVQSLLGGDLSIGGNRARWRCCWSARRRALPPGSRACDQLRSRRGKGWLAQCKRLAGAMARLCSRVVMQSCSCLARLKNARPANRCVMRWLLPPCSSTIGSTAPMVPARWYYRSRAAMRWRQRCRD